eukprot:TRINITY_DN66102_c5_g13_i1.p1 TRINITY_DN66102_c5_g13~~TRINITY_DN66102_c5_g13_i1.p1  ORF type:complete len:202 (-),score=34.63 TRINITY_DN66102_c5_g13_i1:194-769(-)
MPGPTADEVLKYTKPTEDFLCPMSANIYNIEFLSFKIRDLDGNKTLFEVDRDTENPEPNPSGASFSTPEGVPPEVAARTILYHFPPAFLKYKTLGTKLVFSVGDKAVPNFRMIERHYFGDELIKSFDFTFGFCIPNSTNEWEAMYSLPEVPKDREEEIVKAPFKTKSDSFYFVDDQLVMHNKAEYAYNVGV